LRISRGLTAVLGTLMLYASPLPAASNSECFSLLEGLSFGVDFLCWKACVSNLDYAVSFDPQPIQGNTAEGVYEFNKPEWEPGFRVQMGTPCFCGNFGMDASYTSVWSSTKSSVDSGFIYSTLFQLGNSVPIDDAFKARNSVQYQTFDLVLTRCCSVNKEFSVTPFFGLQGVRLDQETAVVGMDDAQINEETLLWRSDFRGLGLKLGTQNDWCLGSGMGLFTKAAAAFVAGYDQDSTQDMNLFLDQTLEVGLHYHGQEVYCLPGLQLSAGLKYDQCWCDHLLSFHMGYEFVNWWNVSQVRRYVEEQQITGIATSPSNANLMMHGLFLGMDVVY